MEDVTAKFNSLRQAVETRFGRNVAVRHDFDLLSHEIFEDLGLQLSSSTLRRFWEYQSDQATANIRETSLDILSKYVGYRSWRQFCNPRLIFDEESSHESPTSRIYLEDLEPGIFIRMKWLPNREVIVRYEGNYCFTILSSQNSKLQAGGKFRCQLMVEGEMLSIADLVYPDKAPVYYCCGKTGGVHFTIIHPQED